MTQGYLSIYKYNYVSLKLHYGDSPNRIFKLNTDTRTLNPVEFSLCVQVCGIVDATTSRFQIRKTSCF